MAEDSPERVSIGPPGGAVLAGSRPQEDVRVHLDPAGHPFRPFLPGA